MQGIDYLSFATLAVGWVLGRISSNLDKNRERRSSRNRLIFHLGQIFEDIAKRQTIDDLVLSYTGSAYKLSELRHRGRAMLAPEADRSAEYLHDVILETASYDPILAQEISATLFAATALDQQLVGKDMGDAEFGLALRALAIFDKGMQKKFIRLTEKIAGQNGIWCRYKTKWYFEEREKSVGESIQALRKFRDDIEDIIKKG